MILFIELKPRDEILKYLILISVSMPSYVIGGVPAVLVLGQQLGLGIKWSKDRGTDRLTRELGSGGPSVP